MNEVSNFLNENSDIDSFDCLLADVNGILRGKRVTRENFEKIIKSGLQMPASTLMLDITGDDSDPGGISYTSGDPDATARIIPQTIARVPWYDKQMAQVLISLYEKDESPLITDSRHVLERVVRRFDDLNLKPVVALEQEFYVFDKEGALDGNPQPPLNPVTGRRVRGHQILSITDLDSFGQFFDDIQEACEIQNIPLGPITSEFATGQFEINLCHTDDLLAAADHALLLPRVVKAIAHKHGFDASFMAKPYVEQSGSGMHMHASLYDEAGNNVFIGEEETGSESLKHAISGLLDLMPASMAIFAPNLNSYRRYKPDSCVPIGRTWGVDNRSVAVRIPGGDPKNRRLEHRIAGADANPYLALAAVLAGIHHGLTTKPELTEISTGNACENIDPGLPLSMNWALDEFRNSEIMGDYLGERYCKIYAEAKKAEHESFTSHVSQREYEWYLRLDY